MKYAIAAGHEETTNTAEEILKSGGNAFDAGIAALLTSFVAEPCMSSAGGGAFANVFTKDGEAKVFDFFCQTPKVKRPINEIDFYDVLVDFGDVQEKFHVGLGATGIPGSIAGIFEMHKHLATIPMRELIQPALKLAKEGVVVNDFQYFDFDLLKKIIEIDEHGKHLFYKNEEIINVGERLYMPQFADFLDYLSREGRDAFYRGEVAQKITRDHQEKGGFLTLEDFENYEVIIRDPLQFKYRGKTILTNPLPSTGGSIIALLLESIETSFPLPKDKFSTNHVLQLYHLLETVEKIEKHPAALAQALGQSYNQKTVSKKWGSTSHFSIIDQWENAISLTTTNGEGCGYFVQGTDIQLNNMLGEAALLPNGFHSWIPDTRLSSMMSPTIVLDEMDKISTVLGSGGASRIPTAIAQVLINLLETGMSLEEAINSPRAHFEHQVFNIEKGFDHHLSQKDFSNEFKEFTQKSMFFGGVHAVRKEKNNFIAIGDNRRDGVAIAYS